MFYLCDFPEPNSNENPSQINTSDHRGGYVYGSVVGGVGDFEMVTPEFVLGLLTVGWTFWLIDRFKKNEND